MTHNAESVAVRCHCCGVGIFGCSGSLSWPDGRPFEGPPEFHCPRCTERHLSLGGPCHAHSDGKEEAGSRIDAQSFQGGRRGEPASGELLASALPTQDDRSEASAVGGQMRHNDGNECADATQ